MESIRTRGEEKEGIHRVPIEERDSGDEETTLNQKTKPKRSRILDPLRHRFASDIVRRLRRQRSGDSQVRIIAFRVNSRFSARACAREREREKGTNENKEPDLDKTHFLFQVKKKKKDTPSSTPRTGSPRRSASSKRVWSGSTRK